MTMLERIAKAIAASDYDGDDLWDSFSQDRRDVYLDNSRAVLDAILEPTEGMFHAGWNNNYNRSSWCAYEAMIQDAKDGA